MKNSPDKTSCILSYFLKRKSAKINRTTKSKTQKNRCHLFSPMELGFHRQSWTAYFRVFITKINQVNVDHHSPFIDKTICSETLLSKIINEIIRSTNNVILSLLDR